MEGENNDETAATADGGAVRTLIWGTTVDPHEAMMKFKDFLLNFTLAHRIQYDLDNEIEVSMLNADLTDSERAPYYPRILAQVRNLILTTSICINDS